MPLHCRALLSFPAGWIHLKYMQRHILLRQQESAAFPVLYNYYVFIFPLYKQLFDNASIISNRRSFIAAQYVLSTLKLPEKLRFFLYYPHPETDLKY